MKLNRIDIYIYIYILYIYIYIYSDINKLELKNVGWAEAACGH